MRSAPCDYPCRIYIYYSEFCEFTFVTKLLYAFKRIDIDQPVSERHRSLETMPANDFILIEKNRDKMIWFITNYTQFLARRGGYEITPLYGRLILDFKSFVYQANLTLPVGYELSSNRHALFDLLLNFETEPGNRFIIWNDAGHLHSRSDRDFREIFEQSLLII
ncbi:hypothetical protein SAMN05216311_101372 [Chitinophaga sp. CF418]|nr:hypothetical protein SAMN05216311_101372 [Chitinophaga sp. CF418]